MEQNRQTENYTVQQLHLEILLWFQCEDNFKLAAQKELIAPKISL